MAICHRQKVSTEINAYNSFIGLEKQQTEKSCTAATVSTAAQLAILSRKLYAFHAGKHSMTQAQNLERNWSRNFDVI
jgi:hypothetical protein